MSDIFDEASNEIKQQRLVNFFRKALPYLVATVFILIAFASLYVYLNQQKEINQAELGDLYNKAQLLLQQEDDQATQESLDYLIKNNSNGYGVFANLQKAQILAKSKQYEQSIEIYETISNNKNIESAFRNLALLRSTALLIEANQDQDLTERFAVLADSKNPFRDSALLLKAAWLIKQRNFKDAEQIALDLVKDEDVSGSIKRKAEALLAINLGKSHDK